jgi:hypothetical protein
LAVYRFEHRLDPLREVFLGLRDRLAINAWGRALGNLLEIPPNPFPRDVVCQ